MDTQTKFKLKKRIRIYLTVAWSMLTLFVLYVAGIMSSNAVFNEPIGVLFANVLGVTPDNPYVLVGAIAILILPLFTGFFFTMLSSLTRQQLHSYRNHIRLYRTRKFATQILALIQAGNIDAAIDIYKKFDLGYDRQLDDYVYGILLGSCKFSGDAFLQKIFDRKIRALQETYDPNKIQL
jgi:hypothetical protein